MTNKNSELDVLQLTEAQRRSCSFLNAQFMQSSVMEPVCDVRCFRNLKFTPQGLARLYHTIGYFAGLKTCGERRGERAIYTLWEALRKLDTNPGRDSATNVALQRCVIRDDGAFGHFYVTFHVLVSGSIAAKAKEAELSVDELTRRWEVDPDLDAWSSMYGRMVYRPAGRQVLSYDREAVDWSWS